MKREEGNPSDTQVPFHRDSARMRKDRHIQGLNSKRVSESIRRLANNDGVSLGPSECRGKDLGQGRGADGQQPGEKRQQGYHWWSWSGIAVGSVERRELSLNTTGADADAGRC